MGNIHRISKKTNRAMTPAVVILLVMMISLFGISGTASALTVPQVTVDSSCATVKDQEPACVTGRVSKAKGQVITLYGEDGKTILTEQTLEDSGQSASYQLFVPEGFIKRPGTTELFVKSQPVKGVAASRMVAVKITAMKSQKITGTSSVTLTNLKTSAKLKLKASSGKKITYVSSNPSAVTVNSSGKLTRHKNGKVTITVRQAGDGTFLPAEKKVTVTSRKSTCKEQIDGAVAWAVKIANDNSFTYGSGQGAHHFGCYFCGTNYGPKKYMKPSKKYKKTYCCNPFISAAYAHGAKHPKMLAACRKASGIDMTKKSYYRFGCWKCVGKPAYKKLKKGDVLVKSSHVAMYVGGGKLVEASGGNWSASSIAVRKMSNSRYHGFSFVMRYTGY